MEKQGAPHLTVSSLQEAKQEADEVHSEIVASLHAAPAAAPEAPTQPQEHPETPTFPLFALVENDDSPKPMRQLVAIEPEDPVKLKNSVSLIAQDDDDYSDLVEALNSFTSHVQTGPNISQKRRKATRLSPQRIAAIAGAVNNI